MILDAVRASGGWAVAAPETRLVEAMHRAIPAVGISICPAAAACVLAIEKLRADERIKPNDRVVMFNTGAATKYVETVPLDLPIIDHPDEVDYATL